MPTSPAPDGLQHLFHTAHPDDYATTLRLGIGHLADMLRRVHGPATGMPAEAAAKAVADVDLARPLGDTGAALLQLRNTLEMVDIADQADSLIYAGTLPNPMTPFRDG